MNNVAKEKARQLRYKKAALARLNLDTIRDELSEISENCDNVRYFIEEDSETLLAALNSYPTGLGWNENADPNS